MAGEPEDEIKEDPPQPTLASLGLEVALLRALGSGSTSERIWKLPMAYTAVVNSNASGFLVTYANNDPSSAVDWSSFAGVFHQFRVSKIRATVTPFYDVNSTGQYQRQVFSYLDADDGLVLPANYQSALAHADTLEIHNGYKPIHRSYDPLKHASNPRDTWNDTASPPAGTCAIKFVGVASPVSTAFWDLTIEYEVEFQGLGA